MKKQTPSQILVDYHALQKEGFKVVKYSEVHWRIFSDGRAVDIWPTSRKYMATGGDASHVYTDVVSAVKSVLWNVQDDSDQESIDKFAKFKGELQDKLTTLGL